MYIYIYVEYTKHEYVYSPPSHHPEMFINGCLRDHSRFRLYDKDVSSSHPITTTSTFAIIETYGSPWVVVGPKLTVYNRPYRLAFACKSIDVQRNLLSSRIPSFFALCQLIIIVVAFLAKRATIMSVHPLLCTFRSNALRPYNGYIILIKIGLCELCVCIGKHTCYEGIAVKTNNNNNYNNDTINIIYSIMFVLDTVYRSCFTKSTRRKHFVFLVWSQFVVGHYVIIKIIRDTWR